MPEDKEKKNGMVILASIIIAISILFSSLITNFAVIDPAQLSNITLKINETGKDENGNIPVVLHDQTTPSFDIFFSQLISRTNLTENASINEYNVTLQAGHGAQVGESLVIFNSLRAYTGEILVINVNNILLDTPLNTNYLTDETNVSITTKELNVDGSTTRETFIITSPSGIPIDITRIMIKMTCTNVPDFDTFCDIATGLDNGIVLRISNGIKTNIFNAKSNAELANLMYDLTFYEQTKTPSVNGVVGRFTFAGQSKHGVAVRLENNETMELIIQDDLTDLLTFRIIAEGHIVDT